MGYESWSFEMLLIVRGQLFEFFFVQLKNKKWDHETKSTLLMISKWRSTHDRRMIYAPFLPFSRAQSFTLLSMGGNTCSFPEQRLVIEPIYDPITLVINLSSSWSRKLATESVSKLTFRALALRHKPIRSDKGLTLETSALNLFTVANSHYQISC